MRKRALDLLVAYDTRDPCTGRIRIGHVTVRLLNGFAADGAYGGLRAGRLCFDRVGKLCLQLRTAYRTGLRRNTGRRRAGMVSVRAGHDLTADGTFGGLGTGCVRAGRMAFGFNQYHVAYHAGLRNGAGRRLTGNMPVRTGQNFTADGTFGGLGAGCVRIGDMSFCGNQYRIAYLAYLCLRAGCLGTREMTARA